jgi:hypothetical protein
LNRAFQRISRFLSTDLAAPLTLAVVCLAAYAPGILAMGFFWDDWVMNWIAQNLGGAGLATYFSTNRPVWGLLYQLTTPVMGGSPLGWQILAILARLLTGVAAWTLVRQTWPKYRPAALWVGLLVVIYPGFTQQHVALLYTHFFLVIAFLLFSLTCTVASLRHPRRFRLLTILGLLLSLANLLMMEYFFVLDLLRPVLVWLVVAEEVSGWRQRIIKTFKVWLPYLGIFLAAGIWRAFLFPFTQENYKLLFVEQLKTQPVQAVLNLAGKALSQTWTATGLAWSQVTYRPNSITTASVGGNLRFVLLSGLILAVLMTVLLLQKRPGSGDSPGIRWGWQALALGAAALLLAGWPFWLTDVPFSLDFAYDRFTLPFMLGTSLVLAGFLDLLPIWYPSKTAILALMVTLAVGWQVETASKYVSDWQQQVSFFQQLTWRVPGLTPGTIVLANEMPIHPTDNSLTAPLNWIYAPGNPGAHLPYLLVYPTIRLGSETLPALSKDQPVRKDYLVAQFTGSTNQAIAVYTAPPACLRFLVVADGNDPSLPGLSKSMAVLSNPAWVTSAVNSGVPTSPIPGIFPASRPGSWCEYYEKADLARSLGQWNEVGRIAIQAGDLARQAIAPTELFPFIEGYAHLGNWTQAAALSQAATAANPSLQGPVCSLWTKIDKALPASPDESNTLQSVGCTE